MEALDHVKLHFGDCEAVWALVAEERVVAMSNFSNRNNSMEMFNNNGKKLPKFPGDG